MFKLKEEARKFFDNDLSLKIKPVEFWNNQKIHENLLDKVENCYIEYGKKIDENSSSLRGWDSNHGNPKSYFHFTVHVNNISFEQYNEVPIDKMMDEMTKVVNRFMNPYVDSE